MIALKGAAVAARIQQEIEAELKDLREGGMERAPRLAKIGRAHV